jgi:Tol biopolymer transport system component
LGGPIPVADDVQFLINRHDGQFALSTNGLLAYSAASVAVRSRLTWFDLDGKKLGTVGAPTPVDGFALSPDSTRAIVRTTSERVGTELWMYDLTRGVARRMPLDMSRFGTDAVWAPDGRRLAYNDDAGIWIASADDPTRGNLLPGTGGLSPYTWTPDGRSIIYRTFDPKTKADVGIVWVTGPPSPRPLVATSAMEFGGDVSPDIHWLAFSSDESGNEELYVTPFPEAGPKWRVTTEGVHGYCWSPDSRRILYTNPVDDRLYEVAMTPRGNALELSAPKVLFGGEPLPGRWGYAADGKRLLVALPLDESVRSEILLVTDWAAAAGVK